MIEIQATKARNSWSEVLDKVLTGEDFLVFRNGRPVAKITRKLARPRDKSGDRSTFGLPVDPKRQGPKPDPYGISKTFTCNTTVGETP